MSLSVDSDVLRALREQRAQEDIPARANQLRFTLMDAKRESRYARELSVVAEQGLSEVGKFTSALPSKQPIAGRFAQIHAATRQPLSANPEKEVLEEGMATANVVNKVLYVLGLPFEAIGTAAGMNQAVRCGFTVIPITQETPPELTPPHPLVEKFVQWVTPQALLDAPTRLVACGIAPQETAKFAGNLMGLGLVASTMGAGRALGPAIHKVVQLPTQTVRLGEHLMVPYEAAGRSGVQRYTVFLNKTDAVFEFAASPNIHHSTLTIYAENLTALVSPSQNAMRGAREFIAHVGKEMGCEKVIVHSTPPKDMRQWLRRDPMCLGMPIPPIFREVDQQVTYARVLKPVFDPQLMMGRGREPDFRVAQVARRLEEKSLSVPKEIFFPNEKGGGIQFMAAPTEQFVKMAKECLKDKKQHPYKPYPALVISTDAPSMSLRDFQKPFASGDVYSAYSSMSTPVFVSQTPGKEGAVRALMGYVREDNTINFGIRSDPLLARKGGSLDVGSLTHHMLDLVRQEMPHANVRLYFFEDLHGLKNFAEECKQWGYQTKSLPEGVIEVHLTDPFRNATRQ